MTPDADVVRAALKSARKALRAASPFLLGEAAIRIRDAAKQLDRPAPEWQTAENSAPRGKLVRALRSAGDVLALYGAAKEIAAYSGDDPYSTRLYDVVVLLAQLADLLILEASCSRPREMT